MREFIRGWRRKAGVVTLVAACVYTVLSVISIALPIRFTISEGATYSKNEVGLAYGFLVFMNVTDLNEIRDEPDCDRNFFGILWGISTSSKSPETQKYLFIPCWPIALPLTAISALLLSKPRPAKNHPDDTKSAERTSDAR